MCDRHYPDAVWREILMNMLLCVSSECGYLKYLHTFKLFKSSECFDIEHSFVHRVVSIAHKFKKYLQKKLRNQIVATTGNGTIRCWMLVSKWHNFHGFPMEQRIQIFTNFNQFRSAMNAMLNFLCNQSFWCNEDAINWPNFRTDRNLSFHQRHWGYTHDCIQK